VLTVGLTGVGLVVAAFVIGLATSAPLQGYEPHKADGPRALLASLGLLLAGCAVSMRPGWYGGWLCGAAAGLIGYGFGASPPAGTDWYVAPPRDWYAGVPNSWDSIQLFFGVAGAIGLIGAAWTRLPWKATLALILAGVAFHFAGILSAVTSPPPTPPVTDQYWRRVAREYLMFAYMNNAYQFYSPDPGPASELWVCIKYMRPGAAENDPDAEKECAWDYVPTRARDYKDPLGLEYYRRLSLTENASQFHRTGYYPGAAEADLIERRRAADDTRIPRYGRQEVQRLVPIDLVTRHVLPSYARHFAKAYARDGWEVRGVKIYRTQHTIITPDQFVGFDSMTNKRVDPWGPYNAALYMPYYQGEFDPKGNLKDPQDHLLYWMVPIVPIRTPPTSRAEYERSGGFKAYFIDYVSVHAGCDRFTDRTEPKPKPPQGPGTGEATHGGRP
jgi:hypothetical protein